jgi:hypothetical protein
MAAKRAAADTATVSAAIRILACGRFSPFEYEGPAVHGFRSALCLAGHPFRTAERHAVIVVTEALRRIGARRPSWAEAQPEWTTPGYSPVEYWYCQNCGAPIDPTTNRNGIQKKWCSALCAGAAADRRARRSGERQSRAMYFAGLAVKRAGRRAAVAAVCLTCGQGFVPKNEFKDRQQFCSRHCYRIYRPAARPCRQCGAEYQPTALHQVYCSDRCNSAHKRARQRLSAPEVLQCACCGTEFPFEPRAKYCSVRCQKRVAYAREKARELTSPPANLPA